jgi:hypothetical protein
LRFKLVHTIATMFLPAKEALSKAIPIRLERDKG